MEGQKLLWIVFSVVLFVVVVLASVLYFLRPQEGQPQLAGRPGGTEFDTYEYVRGSATDLPMTPRTGGPSDLEIVVGGEPTGAGTAGQAGAVAATTGAGATATSPSAATARPAAATPAPQATAKPRGATAPAATPAPRPAAAAPARVFWIQTASFRNRGGAEAMAESLTQKGIAGRLQVSDVGGSAFYRVRVGPYTNREEAEKFLRWIKAVKGLEQSYISVVTP